MFSELKLGTTEDPLEKKDNPIFKAESMTISKDSEIYNSLIKPNIKESN